MTEKRFTLEWYAQKYQELTEENEQLKTQLQNTSDQRDEFHRGARENANRVGKLEKENEQLRHDATILIQSNQDYRKENEQLKQQLEKQKKLTDHFAFQCDCATQIMNEEEELKKDCLKIALEENNELVKENEQLKQFKKKVFFLLDKEIAQNEEAIEWGKEIGADSGSIGFYNHMLKRLKKGLYE